MRTYFSRATLLLFAITTLVPLSVSTHSTYAGSGDEPHYLAIAHSVAFDLDFDVANNYGMAEPLLEDGGLEPGTHTRIGRGSILRPVHDVGMPLLVAPLVRVTVPLAMWIVRRAPESLMNRLRLTPSGLYRHALQVPIAIVGAVLACLLFACFMQTGVKHHLAFWLTLLVALSPPLLIYSILLFTEIVSALLCLVVFRVIALEEHADKENWTLAGVATGLLLLVHIRNIGLVAGLVMLATFRLIARRNWRLAWAYVIPLAVLIALRTAINYHFWGTYFTNPHARLGAWTGWFDLVRTAAVRFAGLMFDQEFGLVLYAPIFILAIAGLGVGRGALYGKIAIVAGAYLLAVVLTITNAHGWTGGWSPAGRLMLPIVPLLALGLTAGVRLLPRSFVATVVVTQVILNMYFWQNPKNLWNDGDGRAAICQRGGIGGCTRLPSFSSD